MMAIKIDTDMFIVALEDHNYETQYFLDTKTGEIEMLTELSDMPEEEELREQIESEAERYISIEPVGSNESFRVMEQFGEQLPAGKARDDLFAALSRRKPFRQFKDALLDYPDIREKWFLFHNQQFKAKVQEWLEDYNISAELLPLPEERNEKS